MHEKIQTALLAYAIMIAIGFAILAFSMKRTCSFNLKHTTHIMDDLFNEETSIAGSHIDMYMLNI